MHRTLPILWCAAAVAQMLPADRQQEIERLVSQEMSRQSIPGLSIAVGIGSEVVMSAGYGMSDIENFVPARAVTQFRTGSIAKPITAVAVMQLVESGKMELDAPIQRYVPSFPQKQWPITVRQLLGHLGGIRHYTEEGETRVTRHYGELTPALRLFQSDALVAEPGTRFHYTTYGYVLLGAATEQASGMHFMDYVRQKILRPAGMERTRDDHVYAIISNRARGYAKSASGAIQNCSLADTSYKIPGGGMISTAEDLVRFAIGVRAAALCRQQSVDAMFTPQRLRDGKTTGYGLGWSMGTLDGKRTIRQTGGQEGASAILSMLPRDGLIVAIMTNLEKAELAALADQVLRVASNARALRETRGTQTSNRPRI
jgi:CubicO group peptidase (beta-lactamase class C family)